MRYKWNPSHVQAQNNSPIHPSNHATKSRRDENSRMLLWTYTLRGIRIQSVHKTVARAFTKGSMNSENSKRKVLNHSSHKYIANKDELLFGNMSRCLLLGNRHFEFLIFNSIKTHWSCFKNNTRLRTFLHWIFCNLNLFLQPEFHFWDILYTYMIYVRGEENDGRIQSRNCRTDRQTDAKYTPVFSPSMFVALSNVAFQTRSNFALFCLVAQYEQA